MNKRFCFNCRWAYWGIIMVYMSPDHEEIEFVCTHAESVKERQFFTMPVTESCSLFLEDGSYGFEEGIRVGKPV